MRRKPEEVAFEDLQEVEKLKVYIWTFYCLVSRSSKKSKELASIPEDFTAQALAAILTCLAFPKKHPDETTDVAGVVPECDSIWLRPNALKLSERVTKAANGLRAKNPLDARFPSHVVRKPQEWQRVIRKRFYEESDPFVTSKASPRIRKWQQAGRLSIPKELGPYEQQVVFAILNPGLPAESLGRALIMVPYRGIGVTGYDPKNRRGVIWMGVRQDAGQADLSPEQRARRLQHPERLIQHVIPAIAHGVTQSTRSPADLDVSLDDFSRLAFRQLVKEVISDDPRTLVETPDELAPGAYNSVVTLYSGRSPASLVARIKRLSKWFARHPKRDRVLVVATALETKAAEEILFEGLSERQLPPGTRILIFGRDTFLFVFNTYPWVWSKFFDSREGFSLVRFDRERLLSVMVLGPAARRVVSIEPRLIHPAMEVSSVRDDGHLCIVGRPGAGNPKRPDGVSAHPHGSSTQTGIGGPL